MITPGFDLPARYVIHAVGPIWRGGAYDEEALLERAYASAFARALEVGDVGTIAFPAISTGVYGFPKDRAARIAIRKMTEHASSFRRIVAALFDDEVAALYCSLLATFGP